MKSSSKRLWVRLLEKWTPEFKGLLSGIKEEEVLMDLEYGRTAEPANNTEKREIFSSDNPSKDVGEEA